MPYDHATSFHRGVRACIHWLHERAQSMNDPHAQQVLNSAAFSLGVDKPGTRSDPPHPDTLILDWLERQFLRITTEPYPTPIHHNRTPDLRAKVLAEMAREKKEQDRG